MRLSDVLTEDGDDVDLSKLEAPENPPVPAAHRPPERAEEDLLVDIGRGRVVQVFKGDPIPARLAGLPRRPMHEASPAAAGRGKARASRRRGMA